MSYDSTIDTRLHIFTVRDLINKFCIELIKRGDVHDQSKLEDPEKEIFDRMTPKLAGTTYMSEEYKEMLKELKPALDHHYKNNSHHPEHYDNGIDGFDLLDLVEMFLDWKAATKRHADGDIIKSIEHNATRFKMSNQLVQIFQNTVDRYDWAKQ